MAAGLAAQAWGSPACAGIDPNVENAEQFESGFPRLRGDRPSPDNLMLLCPKVPPPARG